MEPSWWRQKWTKRVLKRIARRVEKSIRHQEEKRRQVTSLRRNQSGGKPDSLDLLNEIAREPLSHGWYSKRTTERKWKSLG